MGNAAASASGSSVVAASDSANCGDAADSRLTVEEWLDLIGREYLQLGVLKRSLERNETSSARDVRVLRTRGQVKAAAVMEQYLAKTRADIAGLDEHMQQLEKRYESIVYGEGPAPPLPPTHAEMRRARAAFVDEFKAGLAMAAKPAEHDL